MPSGTCRVGACRFVLSVVIAGGALSACDPAAWAAVRICQPEVSSGLQVADTELEARRLAISAWVAAAGAYGKPYTSWRLALSKFYSCAEGEDGKVRCLARARPCVISQVPSPKTRERLPDRVDGVRS